MYDITAQSNSTICIKLLHGHAELTDLQFSRDEASNIHRRIYRHKTAQKMAACEELYEIYKAVIDFHNGRKTLHEVLCSAKDVEQRFKEHGLDI